jgi:hypothetical protein
MFPVWIFTKPPLHLFSGPNRICGAFRGENLARFFLKRPRNRFFEKHVSVLIFLRNRSLTYFWGQMDFMAHFEVKLCSLLPKMPPKSFFRKTRFWSEYFYEIAPSPIFETKQEPKMPPKSFFQKTSFRSKCFYKITPSPIFGDKRIMWLVSKWKLCSLLPKMPPKSFNRKTLFRFEIFFETTSSPIFEAKRTMWPVSRGKLRSLLPKTPPKLCFIKTRFRSEYFY